RGLPAPRRATLVGLRDAAGPFDQGLLLWMPGPRSYTGEDCAELSCHGNPLLVERLVAACVQAGARLARPGEFTRRAWLNGRLDLCRAEAVLQTILARSQAGLEVAAQGLSGELSAFFDSLREELEGCAAEVEARLDFPDQLDHGWGGLLEDEALLARLRAVRDRLALAAATHARARVLVRGARVALIGPVNAGKSSLFNALLGRRRALVAARPGTTRDALEAPLDLDGLEVTLLDTAGERARPAGIERAGLALRDALLDEVDLVVVVLPAHRPRLAESAALLERTAGRPRLLVGNHADRRGARFVQHGEHLLPTCAPTGQGLPQLRAALRAALVGEEPKAGAVLVASQRQHALLLEACAGLERAAEALAGEAGVAVASEELIGVLAALSGLSGHGVREEVLDALFARFCVGK
ncbi:MAG: tRNA uridine-5-carboxymethylaminomethyl(34) synthesis GTPase MnmE, partial [Pseudomonadota bacterium]